MTLEKGWVNRVDEPEKENVEDVIKRLQTEIVALSARVTKLEGAEKRKASAKDDGPSQNKKIKNDNTEEKGKGKDKATKKKGHSDHASKSSKEKGKGRT